MKSNNIVLYIIVCIAIVVGIMYLIAALKGDAQISRLQRAMSPITIDSTYLRKADSLEYELALYKARPKQIDRVYVSRYRVKRDTTTIHDTIQIPALHYDSLHTAYDACLKDFTLCDRLVKDLEELTKLCNSNYFEQVEVSNEIATIAIKEASRGLLSRIFKRREKRINRTAKQINKLKQ